MTKWLGILLFGFSVFIFAQKYTPRFLDWFRYQSLGTRDYIHEELNKIYFKASLQQVFIVLISFSGTLSSVAFLFCLPHLLTGLILGGIIFLISWKIPKPVVTYIVNRHRNTLVFQMVDALSLISNGLRSGLSVVQSFELVVTQMQNPIAQEFQYLLNQNRLGVSIENALNDFSKRVDAEDVEMFVTSINILKETGGNLAETFDTISQTIRDRIKVQNKIASLTAQGYNQGLLILSLPPVLGWFFYQSDPDFMRPLFTTPIGLALLTIIFVLEVGGFFVMLKVMKIEV